jgi:flagellar biogenesis protein FliO
MDVTDGLMRILWALAIVLGLMMLLAVVARRLLGRRLLPPAERPLVRVLGCGYVGARNSIAVVAVAENVFVVGSTADGLVPLGRITDREQVRRLLALESAGGVPEGASSGRAQPLAALAALKAWVSFQATGPSLSEGAGDHGRR